MMPPGGAATRAEGLATLHRLAHELFVRDEIGELLERLRPEEADLDPDSDDACLIAVARRDWEKARRVPAELQAEMTKLSSQGVEAWTHARANDDFAAFRPWLDRTLEVKHRYIECFPATDDPYDVLLDDFEQGMHTDEVRRVFDRLEPALRDLVAASSDEDLEPFVAGPYPRETQHELSLVVARAFGASDDVFRLDPTVHPFCTSFATQDVRVTTRYAEDDLHGSSIFSTMHEVGHGLYEHGGDRALDRTPLCDGLLVRATRVAEPSVGERRRAFAAVLALVLPAVPRRLRQRARRRPARALPPGDQPGATVPDPGRRGRDDVRAPHNPPVPARAGAALRRSLDRGPAGRVERPDRGARGSPSAERPPRLPAGRPLVGRHVRLLPDLPARQRPVRPDLGAARGRPPRRVRAGRARIASARSTPGFASTSTGTVASSHPAR